jgi:hypothetical protein
MRFGHISLGDIMKKGKSPFQGPIKKIAPVTLQDFICIFESKGWLNRTIRIKRRERRYRISCTETGFIAYRINDYSGLSPGVPGWPVCIVTTEQIIDDSEMSRFTSIEPSAQDWLHLLTQGDLEFI